MQMKCNPSSLLLGRNIIESSGKTSGTTASKAARPNPRSCAPIALENVIAIGGTNLLQCLWVRSGKL